jgi:hypothetical protein
MKRYHVRTWGHPTLPDLNIECDEVPTSVKEYPAQSIALQIAIPRSAIEAAMRKTNLTENT